MIIRRLENRTYEEMLRKWALFGLKRRQQRWGDHITVFT